MCVFTFASGTLRWSAPESFFKPSDEQSDVFSFAITLYEVTSRNVPYTGKSAQEIHRIVKARFEFDQSLLEDYGADEAKQRSNWHRKHNITGRRPDLALVEEGCPGQLVGIMKHCWDDTPDKRLVHIHLTQHLLVITVRALGFPEHAGWSL